VFIEQKGKMSPVDGLLILRCFANSHLTKRQAQQFTAQAKIKVAKLKLLGHQVSQSV
jgi:hypothetical protein